MPRRILAEDKEKFIHLIINNLVARNVEIGSLCQPKDSSPLKDYLFVKRLTQDGKEVRYDVLEAKPLGEGSFGAVYRILMTFCERDKQIVPIETSLDRVAKLHFYGGRHNQQALTDSLVIKEQDAIEAETKITHEFDRRFKTQFYNTYAYSIMMEVKGETIEKIIQQQKSNNWRNIDFKIVLLRIIAILRELAYVHAKKWVHHDLKPANIIYCKETLTAKICDFGFSNEIEKSSAWKGTPPYMAPEMLNSEAVISNPTIDMFSISGVIYQLLGAYEIERYETGKNSYELKEMLRQLLSHRAKFGYANDLKGLFDCVVGVSDEDKTAITKYLSEMSTVNDPDKRHTAAQAAAFFEKILHELDPDLYAEQKKNIEKQHIHRNEGLKVRMALQRVNKAVLAQITRLKKEVSCLDSKGNSFKTEVEEINNKLNCLTKIRDYVNKTVMAINSGDYVYDQVKPRLKYAWDYLNSLEVKKALGSNRCGWLPDFFSPASYKACLEVSEQLVGWEQIKPANPIICGRLVTL